MDGDRQISEDTIQLAKDSLKGDVTSFLVDRLRHGDRLFSSMDEDEQRGVIQDAEAAAENLINQVVSIIASDGKDTIMVKVEKAENNGKEIKVTLTTNKEGLHRHALFDAAGHAAHLTVANVEAYQGGELPKPDPDQPDLPVDGE